MLNHILILVNHILNRSKHYANAMTCATFAMSIIRISKHELDLRKDYNLVNKNINNIRSTNLSLNLILTTQTQRFQVKS